MQNYPNPFNPSTQIRFQLAELDNINSISIEIYNSRGQKIRTLKAYPENFSSNKLLGSVNWNGKDDKGQICPSGVYFYNLLLNGTKSAAHKMLLLK
jgi:flagellar hook assembly protein FlgD